GQRRRDERAEVEALLRRGRRREPLGERQGDQEREQDLHAGLRDPQLLEQLDEVAVGALVGGLVPAVFDGVDVVGVPGPSGYSLAHEVRFCPDLAGITADASAPPRPRRSAVTARGTSGAPRRSPGCYGSAGG